MEGVGVGLPGELDAPDPLLEHANKSSAAVNAPMVAESGWTWIAFINGVSKIDVPLQRAQK